MSQDIIGHLDRLDVDGKVIGEEARQDPMTAEN